MNKIMIFFMEIFTWKPTILLIVDTCRLITQLDTSALSLHTLALLPVYALESKGLLNLLPFAVKRLEDSRELTIGGCIPFPESIPLNRTAEYLQLEHHEFRQDNGRSLVVLERLCGIVGWLRPPHGMLHGLESFCGLDEI
jgi:hypothetical protein